MKKLLLLLTFISALHFANASDTLTVSQVFEFAVGDTLDYMLTGNYGNNINIEDTTYTRQVLLNRQLFIADDSILDTWSVLYPVASTFTQIYHGINAHIDVYNSSFYGRAPYILGIDTPAVWDSVRYQFSGSTPGLNQSWYYTKGLGETESYSFSTGNGRHSAKKLIYYNKYGRKAGTPYYYLSTGLSDISTSSIKIYPNPTIDFLHLSFPDGTQYNAHLIITDLLGQQVYSSHIRDIESAHNISILPAGIYTWGLTAEQGVIKTGKLIKQ